MSDFVDDPFAVPAQPSLLRRGHSRIPGRNNFRRIDELDRGRGVIAGDPAAGRVSASEAIALLIDRVESVSPDIARPAIRASPSSNRLINGVGPGGGGGGDPEGQRVGVTRPHIYMPETGTPILKTEVLNTPAADGSSNTVNSYRIPRGQRLVIKAIYNFYTGPGYVQGASPQILWRILRDGQPFKGFEGFRFTYGTTSAFFDLAGELIVTQEQTLTMIAIHEVGSILPVGGTQVVMGFDGWEYPA